MILDAVFTRLVEASARFERYGLPSLPFVRNGQVVLTKTMDVPGRGVYHLACTRPPSCEQRSTAANKETGTPTSVEEVCHACWDELHELDVMGYDPGAEVWHVLSKVLRLWNIPLEPKDMVSKLPQPLGPLPNEVCPDAVSDAVSEPLSPLELPGAADLLSYESSPFTYAQWEDEKFIQAWIAAGTKIWDFLNEARKVMRKDPRVVAAKITSRTRMSGYEIARVYDPDWWDGEEGLRAFEKGKSFAQIRRDLQPELPEETWEELAVFDTPVSLDDPITLWYRESPGDYFLAFDQIAKGYVANAKRLGPAFGTFMVGPASLEGVAGAALKEWRFVGLSPYPLRELSKLRELTEVALLLLESGTAKEPRQALRVARTTLDY